MREDRAENPCRDNKCKARPVLGRGEKSLLYEPGSELPLLIGGRRKKGEDAPGRMWNGQQEKV